MVKVTVTLKPSQISNPKSEISNLKSPPPAIAPFDAKKAKEHQTAWAKYLGVPVEITNSIGMKLVLIPPGEFEMGSPKEVIEEELKTASQDDKWYLERLPGEGPRHHVRITRPFYLGLYPVTQEEYQRVMSANPSEFSRDRQEQGQGSWTGHEAIPCGNGFLVGCRGVLLAAVGDGRGEVGGAAVSAALGGAVGVCVPCGEHGQVLFQRWIG